MASRIDTYSPDTISDLRAKYAATLQAQQQKAPSERETPAIDLTGTPVAQAS